jgi:hypothetical protein
MASASSPKSKPRTTDSRVNSNRTVVPVSRTEQKAARSRASEKEISGYRIQEKGVSIAITGSEFSPEAEAGTGMSRQKSWLPGDIPAADATAAGIPERVVTRPVVSRASRKAPVPAAPMITGIMPVSAHRRLPASSFSSISTRRLRVVWG